jgi:hypothetical protein
MCMKRPRARVIFLCLFSHGRTFDTVRHRRSALSDYTQLSTRTVLKYPDVTDGRKQVVGVVASRVKFGQVDRVGPRGAGAAVEGFFDGERARYLIGSAPPDRDGVWPGSEVVGADRPAAEPAAAARGLLAVPADQVCFQVCGADVCACPRPMRGRGSSRGRRRRSTTSRGTPKARTGVRVRTVAARGASAGAISAPKDSPVRRVATRSPGRFVGRSAKEALLFLPQQLLHLRRQ